MRFHRSRLASALCLAALLLLPAPPAAAETQKTEEPAAAVVPAESSPAVTENTSASPPPSGESEDADRLSFMAEPEHAPVKTEAPSAFGLLLRTVGALCLIVGLVFGAGWGLKRFGGTRFAAPRADVPALAVLSTVTLGDRRSLAVVRFGERTLLVGSTAQAITLLAEEEAEEPRETLTPPARSVADMLKQDATGSFSEELTLAHGRLAPAAPAWERRDGGEG